MTFTPEERRLLRLADAKLDAGRPITMADIRRREAQRVYDQRWREQDPERARLLHRSAQRRFEQREPERARAIKLRWIERNREAISARRRARYAAQKGAPVRPYKRNRAPARKATP